MDDEDVISLHNFGKVFYKYVAETEEEPAHYEKVDVSDENPWIAGLEPKVVTENGKLVLGWYEPNPTTIEGVNDQVTAVQGTVSDLVDSVGAPSSENSEATGLYKEVEDVQEDVEELIDVIGSADDSLSEDVQTIWAHINDTLERIVELEAIDHDVYATAENLTKEAERAAAAEKANADAIKVIADDYLKTEDKYDDTALAARVKAIEDDYLVEADKYDDTAVVGRITAIEADYLKAEHIAEMATKADVSTEAKAREDADKALQDQINLIMNNPDTEGVIDSINEFMQYVEEHGDIAEGFRTDINKNKDDIAAEAEAARAAEGALSDRLDILEAINHDAYIAADEALKNELNGEIAKKADASALTEAVAAIEADIEGLEAADGTMADRLDTLEAKFGEGEGTVEDLIAAAKQEAINTAANDAADKASAAEAAAIAAATEDATSKANAAKADAIADADAKLALKANAADVYAKGETYSQAQVDALLEGIQAGSSESAASVNTKLEALKKTLNNEIYGNDDGSGESRIDIAETKLAGIAEGAQVNVIESVVNAEGSKITATKDGKVITLDDSALREAIRVAKEQADKGVADAAIADGKAVVNTEEIAKHATRLGVLEEAKADHLERIVALEAHDEAHAAEFSTLSQTVVSHGNTIADWTASKANTADLNTAITRIAANEVAIEGLNGEVAKKADATALNSYYTKSEVNAITGTPAEGKTLVQMIADAQATATYDDTEVRGLIATEAARADAAEKANAAEIARVNAVLVAAIENEDDTALNSIKELANWINTHGTEASDMADAIEANANAIAAINHAETGILAVAKAYTNEKVAAIPAATAEALGLVKFDDATIKMNENNQLYVAEVSTDILTQGKDILVLNGGSAKED